MRCGSGDTPARTRMPRLAAGGQRRTSAPLRPPLPQRVRVVAKRQAAHGRRLNVRDAGTIAGQLRAGAGCGGYLGRHFGHQWTKRYPEPGARHDRGSKTAQFDAFDPRSRRIPYRGIRSPRHIPAVRRRCRGPCVGSGRCRRASMPGGIRENRRRSRAVRRAAPPARDGRGRAQIMNEDFVAVILGAPDGWPVRVRIECAP
jgi:hypothetical protein